MKNSISIFFIFCTAFLGCTSDDNYVPTPDALVSPVVFDINEVPYTALSTYQFFEGELNDLRPSYGVLAYDLNSGLFTDYAKKKRLIWMPSEVKASYVNDYTPFNFPVQTVLIKNFYYNNVQPGNRSQILETRLMIKKDNGWIFANYVWNASQTEAFLSEDASIVPITWVLNDETKQVDYKIPSAAECFTCHNKFGAPLPIGPKPQNINRDFLYAEGTKNQLEKWVEQGFLEASYPTSISSTVRWNDTAQPLDLRVRSYIDINCAHCHSEESYCEYRPMRFSFNTTNNLINMGVCVPPETNINDALLNIIEPLSPNESVVFFRMNSTLEEFRMPLLGRTIQHTEGIRLLEEWINSLTVTCD